MDESEELGALLRSHRLRRRWTQQQLAARVQCEVTMVSRTETNSRVPDEVLAARFDGALDIGGRLIEAAREARRRARTRGPGGVPSQLPAAPPLLLGRDAELTRLDQLVSSAASTPIVSVEGGAGVGKSGLALAWAHTHAHRYPDGHMVVRLGGHNGAEPATPHRVLHGMLSDLGVRTIPEETGARSRLLRSMLHQRRMLLLLDDADSTDQVRPLLPGADTCTVLITSRRRLTGLTIAGTASRVPVGPLAETATMALLRRMLPADVATSDETALARIAAGTSGLPLAVRAASSIVTDHPGWSLHELAEHLAGPHRLQVLTTAALMHPAASLRAAFDASYRRLSPQAATLFRALGGHDPTVTTEDAMRLLETNVVEQAQASLAELLGESLLLPTMTGGRGHGLIRVYAAELAGHGHHTRPEDAALSACA